MYEEDRILAERCGRFSDETVVAAEWLRRNRVGQYQGYLFSPPISVSEFEALCLQAQDTPSAAE